MNFMATESFRLRQTVAPTHQIMKYAG